MGFNSGYNNICAKQNSKAYIILANITNNRCNFRFILNVIVLNIVDIILGNHFEIHGFFMSVIVSICISIMNVLMDNLIISPIIERSKKR